MSNLLYWYILYNVVCLLVYGLDKALAIKKKRFRISERWLCFLSLFGGVFGCLLGMFLFRHKTKKVKFYLWNIIMLMVWVYIILMFIF